MDREFLPDESENRGGLADEAARCRRLADAITDRRTIASLTELAREYDARAHHRMG